MKRRFVLTPEATADLREILLDIAEDSADAAERLRSEFPLTPWLRLQRSPQRRTNRHHPLPQLRQCSFPTVASC